MGPLRSPQQQNRSSWHTVLISFHFPNHKRLVPGAGNKGSGGEMKLTCAANKARSPCNLGPALQVHSKIRVDLQACHFPPSFSKYTGSTRVFENTSQKIEFHDGGFEMRGICAKWNRVGMFKNTRTASSYSHGSYNATWDTSTTYNEVGDTGAGGIHHGSWRVLLKPFFFFFYFSKLGGMMQNSRKPKSDASRSTRTWCSVTKIDDLKHCDHLPTSKIEPPEYSPATPVGIAQPVGHSWAGPHFLTLCNVGASPIERLWSMWHDRLVILRWRADGFFPLRFIEVLALLCNTGLEKPPLVLGLQGHITISSFPRWPHATPLRSLRDLTDVESVHTEKCAVLLVNNNVCYIAKVDGT
jgi:hypothetical protein